MSTNIFKGATQTDTALVTTAETVVATVSGVATGRPVDVAIRGTAQLTTGTATTAVTPRIRRGTTVSGTLIDEGNPVTIGAAAGGTEVFEMSAIDEGLDASGVSYVLTLQQTAATGNGSCLQAYVEATVPQ